MPYPRQYTFEYIAAEADFAPFFAVMGIEEPALTQPGCRCPGCRFADEQAALRQTMEARLLDLLSPANRVTWRQRQYVIVRGSAGGIYRIHEGVNGNIRRIESCACHGYRFVEQLCGHPPMRVSDAHGRLIILPVEYCVMIQILALITDEPAFRAVAVRSIMSTPVIDDIEVPT